MSLEYLGYVDAITLDHSPSNHHVPSRSRSPALFPGERSYM